MTTKAERMKTPHDTEKVCHCGGHYRGSDHCPRCHCEQYESVNCSTWCGRWYGNRRRR